ncbi:hypothetical protein QRX50_13240 [Amycolatopsis carbonis]|uniref:Uncharacterized protein n=1 Tax=Amycolatopsis carbonis TaxID=715471 RepID=A0A9Y2IN33_9PSEU|nr:hypothetical protein [Amycolatopsis sp. 2-15]WIX81648.1 hypothetical protein QRX50_13240 [Amycolatopsis sp. 2-15]
MPDVTTKARLRKNANATPSGGEPRAAGPGSLPVQAGAAFSAGAHPWLGLLGAVLGSWQWTLRASIIAGEVLFVVLAVFAPAAHSVGGNAANAGIAGLALAAFARRRRGGGRHRKTTR